MNLGYFRTFARYNAWANRRLYAACAELPEGELMKPRAAFFGSIHGTLNHIMVGDRMWIGRVTSHVPQIASLDQILYADFVGLRVAREAEDAHILNVIEGLAESRLDEDLAYRTMAGEAHRTPLRLVLGHMFNHQTHHRGQAHGLLSQTAVAPPPLDLIHYLREAAAASG